ncbi:hypothetical protein, partial [Paraburkholderia sp. UYCP14C]|uniref:hypothetical protein n=1 Tax=Paraburkholderia sp. UYCP14C TaxID=2511130 RepID=UPI001B7D5F28
FNINYSSLDHTFYPNSVSRKTGAAALQTPATFSSTLDFMSALPSHSAECRVYSDRQTATEA